MNILPVSDIPPEDYLYYLNTLDQRSLGLWGFTPLEADPAVPCYIATSSSENVPPNFKRTFQNLDIGGIEYSAFITKQTDLYWITFTFGDYSVFNVEEFEEALKADKPFCMGTFEKRTVWIGV